MLGGEQSQYHRYGFCSRLLTGATVGAPSDPSATRVLEPTSQAHRLPFVLAVTDSRTSPFVFTAAGMIWERTEVVCLFELWRPCDKGNLSLGSYSSRARCDEDKGGGGEAREAESAIHSLLCLHSFEEQVVLSPSGTVSCSPLLSQSCRRTSDNESLVLNHSVTSLCDCCLSYIHRCKHY